MQFIAVFAALIALCAGKPYTIAYYAARNCNSIRISCKVDAWECCEAPPAPASFPSVEAYSAGETAFVVFTDVTAGGGCGACRSTGAVGVCFENRNPFNTAFIIPLSRSCSREQQKDMEMFNGSKEQLENPDPQCNTTVPLTSVDVRGQSYRLVQSDRTEMIDDASRLSEDEYMNKWEKHRTEDINR